MTTFNQAIWLAGKITMVFPEFWPNYDTIRDYIETLPDRQYRRLVALYYQNKPSLKTEIETIINK